MSERDARIYVFAFVTGILSQRIGWMDGYGILAVLALLCVSVKITPWLAGRNAMKEGR